MSLFTIEHLHHSYGDYTVFNNACLNLYKGEHMGVLGSNGTGKSTLLGILAGKIVPDSGDLVWYPRLSVGYLDQHAVVPKAVTVEGYLWETFDALCRAECAMQRAYEDYAADGDDAHLRQAAELQETLERAGYYGLQTRIDKVAEGLGLRAIGMDRPLEILSGGERAKVMLARLLLEGPDLLLLDEPTNFLDKRHINWLAEYLQGFEGAFMVVSHDAGFLERVVNCICAVGDGGLTKYHGSYAHCLNQMEQGALDYRRRYEAQQREIAQTESYIRRNIAGVNTRIAKGRRTRLERLERLEAPRSNQLRPSFHYVTGHATTKRLLAAEDIVVGYDHPLLPPQSLSLHRGEKLVVVGGNGVGKSTLLKTLVGRQPALAGCCTVGEGVALSYFDQVLSWCDPQATPLNLMMESMAGWDKKHAYVHLARCGVSREHAGQAIATLSGGEQAKVKLALLALREADLLVFDEPTNHLDAMAKAALGEALRSFEGGILLVSHEPAFYTGWVDGVLDLS